MMKRILLFVFGLTCMTLSAQNIQYTKVDSIVVRKLLQDALKLDKDNNLIIHFSHQLLDIPYVAKTLEVNKSEQLIVNLRQLDCTTFVENVMALTLCANNGKTSFEDFCKYLRLIRYRKGVVSYPTRLHYFTEWIEDNTQMNFVKEIQQPDSVFTQVQTLAINFMSTHSNLYPMLADNPLMIKDIEITEENLTGRQFRYIPKEEISNTDAMRNAIQDGDIIAITTKKKGLDTSHIGFAIWHLDGLHLINASQIHKKVVEEPMTLYDYMQKHPSQKGIRIVRWIKDSTYSLPCVFDVGFRN